MQSVFPPSTVGLRTCFLHCQHVGLRNHHPKKSWRVNVGVAAELLMFISFQLREICSGYPWSKTVGGHLILGGPYINIVCGTYWNMYLKVEILSVPDWTMTRLQ